MKTNLFTDNFTPKQIQAIKDTIRYGFWGDADQEFLKADGTFTEAKSVYVYITNDAHKGGHFPSRRSLSGVFSGIARRIQEKHLPFIYNIHDWWGDGSGDVMYFDVDLLECTYEELEEWATKDNPPCK